MDLLAFLGIQHVLHQQLDYKILRKVTLEFKFLKCKILEKVTFSISFNFAVNFMCIFESRDNIGTIHDSMNFETKEGWLVKFKNVI
jgi:hypothetical protein